MISREVKKLKKNVTNLASFSHMAHIKMFVLITIKVQRVSAIEFML